MGWAGLGAELLDVLNPSVVLIDLIGRETDYLYTTSSKVWSAAGDFTELSGANRGKIIYERGSVSLRGLRWKEKSYQDGRRGWPMCTKETGSVSVIGAICTMLSTHP